MGRWNVYGEYSSGESMRLLIRDIRGDEEGVASTVGTIMALLVFLTFLSLIVNQYVPVWMKDSEASHMNGALGQFGGIKGAIDLQILAAQAARIWRSIAPLIPPNRPNAPFMCDASESFIQTGTY